MITSIIRAWSAAGLAVLMLLSGARLWAQSDLILSGSNSWILHTPDDGRKMLYFAPGINGSSWDWSKQTMFFDDGHVSFSGMINANGRIEVNLGNPNGWGGDLRAARFLSPDNNYFLDLKTYIVGAGNTGYHFSPNNNTGLVITTPGNVGIGTAAPTHKLSVNGAIRAKEVIVDTSWSDYVFDETYQLQPLADVESHIKATRHLPGVPSASEVAEKGVSVGEMQAILLAKIEELTLHVIAQEKTQVKQAKRIYALEVENAQLKLRAK
jgi:hypothetical protein